MNGDTRNNFTNPFAPQPSVAPSSSTTSNGTESAHDSAPEKWGTHQMGAPSAPSSHPDNQRAAAFWAAADQSHQHPYIQLSPADKPSSSPMDSILHKFNSWSGKAETMANNIWHNLKTGSSLSEAAWGKMNLRAKAMTEGGFEALYKQSFSTCPNEKLLKSFACYLSTSAGPVAGTLYLSNLHVAFCSDRPLSFPAPSGQQTWSYYKVMVPLGKIKVVNPVAMRENPSERYIQVGTIDGHDFWLMGFVNYEKASKHLSDAISGFVATGVAVPPVGA